MLRTFTVRDLVRMGKRLDRVAEERAEQAQAPAARERADDVERQSRRLRLLRRRRSTS